jgi:hypothetical protein
MLLHPEWPQKPFIRAAVALKKTIRIKKLPNEIKLQIRITNEKVTNRYKSNLITSKPCKVKRSIYNISLEYYLSKI